MNKVLALLVLASGFSAFATDLTWVNWDGDLKASTAENWSPAQVPQTGDNLYIYYDGNGTKYWHNDLDVEYGHVDLVVSNTTNSRVDIDQKEVRVSNGFSFLGKSGTFYGRTAVTGTGDFIVDCPGGTAYLATSPTSGNVYSGNFIIKTGKLNANAENVLGDETRHGYVYLHAHAVANGGSFGTSGSWTMWNDFYYDNDSSAYAFGPSTDTRYNGDFYFNGGSGTIQHGGGVGKTIDFYGKWIRWAPEGKEKSTSVLQIYSRNPGFVFYGGYQDDMAPLTIFTDDAKGNIVTIASKVELPYGVKFNGGSKLIFAIDDASDAALPLELKNSSVVDLAGTRQRFSDIKISAGAGTIQSSTTGGQMIWSPTLDTMLAPALTGTMDLVFDAETLVGTVGSSAFSGKLQSKAGTLVVAADSSLPNVSDIVIDNGATLQLDSTAIGSLPAFHIVDGANLEIASGLVLNVGKAYLNGARMAAGDYTYGEGTLRVNEVFYTWTDLGGDGDLSNPANWSGDGHPQTDDAVSFMTSPTVPLTGTLTANTITVGDDVSLALAASATLSAGQYEFGNNVSISSDSPAIVQITGAGSYDGLPISGFVKFEIAVGEQDVITLSGQVDAETIRVSSGVLTLATEQVSESLVLESVTEDQLSVAEGLMVPCYMCKVGDSYLDPGEVVMGAGALAVYASGAPAEEKWYVWTGSLGPDDKSIFADGNWLGNQAPKFTVGNEKISFPNGGVVEILADTEARVHTLKVENELTIEGAGKLAVGAGGADLSGTALITISPTVEFLTAGQVWTFTGNGVNLKFMGPLMSHPRVGKNGQVSFETTETGTTKKSRSYLWFDKGSPNLNCPIVVSNVVCDICTSDAFSAEYGVTIYNAHYEFTQDPHMFKCGMEVDFPVTIYDHYRELVNGTGPTFASVTFNYPVKFLRSAGFVNEAANITVRDAVIFNAPVLAGPGLVFNNVATMGDDKGVIFNDKVEVSDPDVANNDFRNSNGPISFRSTENTYPSPFRLTGSGAINCLAENVMKSDVTVIFYGKSGIFNLNGFNQTIPALWANFGNADCCFVKSNGKRAVLTLTDPTVYNASYPFAFTDGAGVEFVLAANKTVTFIRSSSLTKGPLIVDGGTVAFDTDSSWHGRSDVIVKAGATLQTSAAETFGDATDGYSTALDIANGGVLNISADETVKSLVYDGNVCAPGTYGKVGSGAEHELACFTGDGILTVTSVPLGGLIMLIK